MHFEPGKIELPMVKTFVADLKGLHEHLRDEAKKAKDAYAVAFNRDRQPTPEYEVGRMC
jgi:hypothetical protein